LTLGGPLAASLGLTDTVVIMIADNDGIPEINLEGAIINTAEDAGTLSVSVTLSNPSDSPVEVAIMSSDGSAIGGDDYGVVSETLTFAPLETVATVTVPIFDDSDIESTETFTITLSAPTNGKLGLVSEAQVVISDNDVPLALSISNGLAMETDLMGSMRFTVSLNAEATFTVTVEYETVNGSALAGEHYTATSGILIFRPGEIEKVITVPLIGDYEAGQNLDFGLRLFNPSVATIEDGEAIGTIIDDDIIYTFIPMVSHENPQGPDLVVTDLDVSSDGIEVTIRNIGDQPVTNAFWVDVYIDPERPPRKVNETIALLNSQGAAWAVTEETLPLRPGDSLILRLNDDYYFESESSLPQTIEAGLPVYAQVDSAASDTPYGGVYEGHERREEAYNNIFEAVSR
ncbi:MAG: Calx-beta domain-containing protein, partial [Chloroflexota bacterium]